MSKTISIVGFGRFGKTLLRLFPTHTRAVIFDLSSIEIPVEYTFARAAASLEEVYQQDVIFICVPISMFESVIKEHKHLFANKLLVDVLSVKVHPQRVFKEQLKATQARAILTHPMFGPDSAKESFENLPIVIDKFTATQEEYDWIKHLFRSNKLKIIEMAPDSHDRFAANSQGVAHYLGRILEDFRFSPTPIDTKGAHKLLEIKEQTCNDTFQLFTDLQIYNPYTKAMRAQIGESIDRICNKLLPDRVLKGQTTIGIQGGRGSFNETALLQFIETNNIRDAKIEYLYTSENVLSALHHGDIDLGQFAIHNTLGSMVGESLRAMSKYKFTIVSEFYISIRHNLMKRKDVTLNEIDTIMAHPQVFLQCKHSLARNYSHLKQVVGDKDLVDTAKAAEAVMNGDISKNTAILGNILIAEYCDFDVVERDLQDNMDNFTTFFVVSR